MYHTEEPYAEKSQAHKATYCIMPFTGNVQDRQSRGHEVEEWLPGADVGRMGSER